MVRSIITGGQWQQRRHHLCFSWLFSHSLRSLGEKGVCSLGSLGNQGLCWLVRLGEEEEEEEKSPCSLERVGEDEEENPGCTLILCTVGKLWAVHELCKGTVQSSGLMDDNSHSLGHLHTWKRKKKKNPHINCHIIIVTCLLNPFVSSVTRNFPSEMSSCDVNHSSRHWTPEHRCHYMEFEFLFVHVSQHI